MATTNSATQAVVQHLIATVSSPALPTHAPIQLEAFRAELHTLLDRLQAYHWSAHFPIQAKRIYGTGTHNLRTVITSPFIDHPIIAPARALAWTQFETLMDRYVNAGTTTRGSWLAGLRVREYDTDVNNDQLEALVVCLLAVKEDVDGACEAVVRAGGREWWVVPSPMAHFATDATGTGLGVFKFEDQSRHTVAIGAPPQSTGVYYPTYTAMPEGAGAPVEEVAEMAIEGNPWAAFLEEEKDFESSADCMSAMMEDETFFEEQHWTVVEI